MARQLVKIHFELSAKDWHGHGGEFLWATPVDDNAPENFRIMNSPYFTAGINYCDVVKATPSKDEAVFEFENVVERSGHSTYMLIVNDETPQFRSRWNALEEKGCSHESMEMNFSMGRQLWSVDVPPSASLTEVYDILEKGESEGVWLFQEGYAHLPKK
jgi:hypothetical protein